MAAAARFLEAGNYHAYLLRLTRADADHPWEMVAKDVETGEEYPLADADGKPEHKGPQHVQQDQDAHQAVQSSSRPVEEGCGVAPAMAEVTLTRPVDRSMCGRSWSRMTPVTSEHDRPHGRM